MTREEQDTQNRLYNEYYDSPEYIAWNENNNKRRKVIAGYDRVIGMIKAVLPETYSEIERKIEAREREREEERNTA